MYDRSLDKMNYMALDVINPSPQDMVLSDSHNLSRAIITSNLVTPDSQCLMGVLTKCSSDDRDITIAETPRQITSTNSCSKNTRSDRKVQLNFSVDRLLGIDRFGCDRESKPDRCTVNDHSIVNGGGSCFLDDCGYDCCKYSTDLAISSKTLLNYGSSGAIQDIRSIVRPTPIRMANRINAVITCHHQPHYAGSQQIVKFHSSVANTAQNADNRERSPFKIGPTSSQLFQHPLSQLDGASASNQGTGTSTGKRKRSWSRAVFSNLQRKGLEIQFQVQKYITKPDRRKLAARLNLTDAQVKVWFQNRRMKWRHTRENLKSGQEKPMEENPASPDEAGTSSDEDEIDVVAE